MSWNGLVLDARTRAFIEAAADVCITNYEKSTGNKYKSSNINCVLNVLNFMEDNLVYVNNLKEKYNINKMAVAGDGYKYMVVIDYDYI